MTVSYLNMILSASLIGMTDIKILLAKYNVYEQTIDLQISRSVICLSVMHEIFQKQICVFGYWMHQYMASTSFQIQVKWSHGLPNWSPTNIFSLWFMFYDKWKCWVELSTNAEAPPLYCAGNVWFDPDVKQQIIQLCDMHKVKLVLFLWSQQIICRMLRLLESPVSNPASAHHRFMVMIF